MSTPGDTIEGRLEIRLSTRNSAVSILSSRPLLVARLFEGKSVEETLTLVPLLFNVCGQAQSIAAVRAIESASQRPASPADEANRHTLKQLETLREHLWRVLLEWPGFYGGERVTAALVETTGQLEAMKQAVDPQYRLCSRPQPNAPAVDRTDFVHHLAALRNSLESRLYATDLDTWLALDASGLQDWFRSADSPAGRLLRFVDDNDWSGLGPTTADAMPWLDDDQLLTRLDADDADSFIAEPQWQGERLETGPAARLHRHPLLVELAQRHGHGLMLRLVARLIEIAQITRQLADPGAGGEPFSCSAGLAQLEAARGRLCHRVTLAGDKIESYRILAPTEWNFGPTGVAAEALRGVHYQATESARTQASLLIHAIDPCVGYNLKIEAA